MATNPDVRIRLSAEGVQEVVNALKQVQAQAGQAKTATNAISSGMDKAAGSVAMLKGSVAGLSAAFATLGGIGYLSTLNEHAIAIGRLSQITGITVEQLSRLTHAFKQNGVDEEGALGALGALAEKLYEARTGVGDAAAAFRDLGLQLKDSTGKYKDLRTMLGELADAYSKHADGIGKTSNALMLMGDDGARLLPVLNKGAAGLDKLEASAAKAGATLSTKATVEAQQFNNTLADLKSKLDAVARTLTGPLVAGLNAFIDRFQKAKDAGKGVAESVASGLGLEGNRSNVLKAEEDVAKFTQLYEEAVATKARLAGTLAGKFRFDLSDEDGYFKKKLDKSKENLAELRKLQAVAASPLPLPDPSTLGEKPNLTLPPPPGLGAPPAIPKAGPEALPELPTLGTVDNAALLAKAAKDQQAAEAAARLQQKVVDNQAELAQESAFYAESERTLFQYYAVRERIIKDESAAELDVAAKALEAAKAATANTDLERAARDSAVAQADANLTRLKAANELKLKQLSLERYAELEGLKDAAAATELEQMRLTGQAHQAELLALEKEVEQYGQLLAKLGDVNAERKKQAMLDAGTGRINFEKARTAGEGKLTKLDEQKAGVESALDTGQLWGFEAEAKVLELERQRVVVLKDMYAQLKAAADQSKDPALIEQARQVGIAVKEAEDKTRKYGQSMRDLKEQGFDAAVQGFSNFLTELSRGNADLAASFQSMALSVVQALQQMLIKMLAVEAMKAAFGFAGISMPGSAAVAKADGGYISGPGTGTSDSIPAWLSNGEYVIRASAVSAVGLDALHEINRKGRLPAARVSGVSSVVVSRFADGGLVGSVEGNQGGASSLTVGLDDGLVLKKLQSPAGQKLILEAIGQQRRAVRQIIS